MRLTACAMLLAGIIALVAVNTDAGSNFQDRAVVGFLCAALMGAAVGLLVWGPSVSSSQIMRLAEARMGVLTLSEIVTALNVEPEHALRALQKLQRVGIAKQRWQEIRKNVWEFPDYMSLPISESIELAKAKGGRLTLDDLVASGHDRKTARETLDALSDKGLAQSDPGAATPTLVVTTQ